MRNVAFLVALVWIPCPAFAQQSAEGKLRAYMESRGYDRLSPSDNYWYREESNCPIGDGLAAHSLSPYYLTADLDGDAIEDAAAHVVRRDSSMLITCLTSLEGLCVSSDLEPIRSTSADGREYGGLAFGRLRPPHPEATHHVVVDDWVGGAYFFVASRGRLFHAGTACGVRVGRTMSIRVDEPPDPVDCQAPVD